MSITRSGKGNSLWLKNFILLGLVIVLAVIPLVILQGAEFGGADGEAEGVIAEIAPGYTPWFESLWEPPSGEIESLLFVLQGALGAGVAGYCLGYLKGRKKQED